MTEQQAAQMLADLTVIRAMLAAILGLSLGFVGCYLFDRWRGL